MAKARASLASAATPKFVDGRTSMGEKRRRGDDVDALPGSGAACCAPTEEDRSAVSWDMMSGFWEPPPETISCWILCLGRTKRWSASAMEAAVKTVTVWRRSLGLTW